MQGKALWTPVGSESLRERQVCAWWGSDHPGLFLPAKDPQLLCQHIANPCWCRLKVKSRKPTLSLCGRDTGMESSAQLG